MATTRSDKDTATATGELRDRGSGTEGYQASVDALTDYQDGRTLDDPEVGPDGQVIVSPFSQQQMDERIENGEGEALREELAEAAEGLKSQKHGGRRDESTSTKSSKSRKDKDDER
jgi:hypothetical protein